MKKLITNTKKTKKKKTSMKMRKFAIMAKLKTFFDVSKYVEQLMKGGTNKVQSYKFKV